MRRNRSTVGDGVALGSLIVLGAALCSLVGTAAATGAVPGAGSGTTATAPAVLAGAPGTTKLLSNESTFTRWAHPRSDATIRAAPSDGATPLGRLHMRTEEGRAEVYLLLREARSATGEPWVLLRIPARPNGGKGWVPLAALDAMHLTDMALRVNLRLLRATLFKDGVRVWSAPVGVGKQSTPTPTGHFWVRERLAVSGHPLYGPYAFGTSDYSDLASWPRGGVVGIHGTDQPSLVPGRPSHGCVRMRNSDILFLARRLPVGAPVHIVG